MVEPRMITVGSLQTGGVHVVWQGPSGAGVGSFGKPRWSQPVAVVPSSHTSPSWTTLSPQNVQSGRHFGWLVPGISVGSGGSQVSPGSRCRLPQVGGLQCCGQEEFGTCVHSV